MNAEISTWTEALFLGVFFFLYFGVPALLVWVSYSDRPMCKNVDIRALWMWNERPDKLAVIILGTWWVHTCSMILWALLRTVATQDYITYMGWAIPIMLKMWAPQNDAAPPPPDKP